MKNFTTFAAAICLLAVFAFTSHKSILTSNTTELVADWERAKASTKEYLDAATEDVINYKPTPEMRSFAEQMLHLATMPALLPPALERKDYSKTTSKR